MSRAATERLVAGGRPDPTRPCGPADRPAAVDEGQPAHADAPPRAGAHPGRRARTPAGCSTSSSSRTRSSPTRASPDCPSRRRSTSSSTSRPIRGRSRTTSASASSTCSASSPSSDGEPDYLPIWGHDRDGERDGLRALHRPRHRAPRGRPGDARLPLRRLRVGRRQAAHAAPPHPRGGGRSAPARPGLRGSPERRPPGHPRVGRVVLHQAHRALLHAAARGAGHRGRLQRRPVRDVAARRRRIRSSCSTSSAAYNRDDCISTWLLRDWLEARRQEAIDRGWAMPRPRPPELRAERSRRSRAGRSRAGARRRCGGHLARTPSATPRGAGPLAALAARRLASARGPAGLVELVPIAGDAARGAHRAGRGHRRASTFVGDVEEREEERRPALSLPAPGGQAPAGKDAVDPDHPPEGLGSGAGDVAGHRRRGRHDRPLRGPTEAGVPPGPPAAGDAAPVERRCAKRSAPSPTGSSSAASTPTDRGARLGTCCSGGHRGSIDGPAPGPLGATASPASRPHAGWRSSSIAASSASRGRRGPARRGPARGWPRARSRRAGASASPPSPTRRSRNMLRAIDDAAREAGRPIVPSRPARTATTRTDLGDRSSSATNVGVRSAPTCRPAVRRRRRHAMALRPRRHARRGRRPLRRRGGPDVAGQRHRHERRDELDRPARRPEPAAAGHAGRASGRRRCVRARPSHRRRRDDRARARPAARHDLPHASGGQPLHLDDLLRRAGARRRRRRSADGRSGRPRRRRHPLATRSSTPATTRARSRRPRPSSTPWRRWSDGEWVDQHGRTRGDHRRRHHHRRALQPPGRGDRGGRHGRAASRPGSARSTSSRARRARSPSTR